jgi:peptide/nickel transport system substrate-binding protein
MDGKQPGRKALSLSRWLLALLLAAPLALGCIGCGGGSGKQDARAEAEHAGGAPTPHRGGTVVVGWSAQPSGVNEYTVPGTAVTTEINRQLFLHLVQELPDFERHPPTFAPELAESFDWSPDHKTLTFHLRKDMVWSDGVPFTADDVRFTWQAQTNPQVAWDSAAIKSAISDVEIVDPHTVRFHFSRVYAKQFLDVNEGGIIPKHAWEKLPFARWRESSDWFRDHLVVDGPFTVASWKPEQDVVLVRNPRYYRHDRPLLDRVVVRPVADQASLTNQLLSGQIDFVPQFSPSDLASLQKNPDLRIIPYWFRLYVVVIWNTTDPLFSDPEVRRAMTLAIDRQTIVDTVLGSTGRVATSPVVSGVWAHDASLRPWPYDPAEARRILAAHGWKDSDGDGVLDKNGKPFAFEIGSNGGNQQRNDAAVMIQSQLQKIDVRAEPRILEFNTLISQASEGKFGAMIFGFTMDTGMDLTSQFHSSQTREEGNFGAYSNPEVDRLIEQTMSVSDIRDARPALNRIQQIVHRDQPMTFLWESQRLTAVRRRVHDAAPNVLFSLYNLQDWWIEPGQ